VHAYERNHRAYNNARDPKGPVYITIGDGGNREGLATRWLAQTSVSAFREATYGHGELEVFNATHMQWTWHTNPDAESKVRATLLPHHPASPLSLLLPRRRSRTPSGS